MPEVRPVGTVDLVDTELGVIDRVEVALLLKHQAAVVLIHRPISRVPCPTLRHFARNWVRSVVDPVARVDLQRRLVCQDIQPVERSQHAGRE